MNNSILLDIFTLNNADHIWAQLAPLSESDWEALIAQARLHKIISLLWQRLKLLGLSERLPAIARQSILTQLKDIGTCNLANYLELMKLLAELEKQGIGVILLKGLHLTQTAYRDLALRPMIDMDILVRKEHLAPVQAILLDWGYVPTEEQSVEMTCALGAHHLPCLTKVGNPYTHIEIHWHIEVASAPFAIDLDGLWQRSQWWQLGAFKVGGLSPEDLLLHLSIHAAYHHLFDVGLIVFFDVAKTIEYYETVLDWDSLQKRAVAWGAIRPLFLTLYLARELAGANVPEASLTSLVPDDPHKWVELAKQQLMAKSNLKHEQLTIDTLASVINTTRKWESWAELLHFLRQMLFPNRQRLKPLCPWFKHSFLVYLCLPLIWLRYLKQYGWPLLQWIFSRKKRQQVNTQLQQLEPSVELHRWFIDD